jgi:hypothetical protein
MARICRWQESIKSVSKRNHQLMHTFLSYSYCPDSKHRSFSCVDNDSIECTCKLRISFQTMQVFTKGNLCFFFEMEVLIEICQNKSVTDSTANLHDRIHCEALKDLLNVNWLIWSLCCFFQHCLQWMR